MAYILRPVKKKGTLKLRSSALFEDAVDPRNYKEASIYSAMGVVYIKEEHVKELFLGAKEAPIYDMMGSVSIKEKHIEQPFVGAKEASHPSETDSTGAATDEDTAAGTIVKNTRVANSVSDGVASSDTNVAFDDAVSQALEDDEKSAAPEDEPLEPCDTGESPSTEEKEYTESIDERSPMQEYTQPAGFSAAEGRNLRIPLSALQCKTKLRQVNLSLPCASHKASGPSFQLSVR
jgi:hypothetical protein